MNKIEGGSRMSEGVRAAWIIGAASIVAAVLGAIVGRPVINEVVGTTDKIERLTEENQALRKGNSDSTALKTQVAELESQLAKCRNIPSGNPPHTPEQPPAPSPQAPEPQEPMPSTPVTVEELGYSFSLIGCDRSGSSVTCNLTIENQRDERSLKMSRPRVTPVSRLVDDLGNEAVADSKSLGRSVGSSVMLLMPRQVPIRASINFEGVAPEAKVLRLLEIGCVTEPEYKQFAVQFRNVNLH
jgi:hypothetical protein